MMQVVPESHRDLVAHDSKAIAYLATTMPDGSPIISPIWFGVVDDYICFFTGLSRLKTQNMIARPDVAIVFQDPEKVYRYVQVRGQYVKYVEDGAREFLDELSNKYVGTDYDDSASSDGVLVYIKPERANIFG